jgi:hypothetical protein
MDGQGFEAADPSGIDFQQAGLKSIAATGIGKSTIGTIKMVATDYSKPLENPINCPCEAWLG